MKNIKSFLLMLCLVLLFVSAGYSLAGISGMKIALLFSLLLNFYSYYYSDMLVLKHYSASEVNAGSNPKLYNIVKNLTQKADLPMPKVYIIPDDVPNAFATGRNPKNAAVAATSGLLNLLDDNEIEGVIAHELSHIKHYDILTGSIAAVFAGAVAVISNMARFNVTSRNNNSNNRSNGLFALVAIILMPIAATIIRLGVSRTREYEADEGAATLTQKPQYLASALAKLDGYSKNYGLSKATLETAHIFIVNPFSNQKAEFLSLFSTHPTTADRIKRLSELAKKM